MPLQRECSNGQSFKEKKQEEKKRDTDIEKWEVRGVWWQIMDVNTFSGITPPQVTMMSESPSASSAPPSVVALEPCAPRSQGCSPTNLWRTVAHVKNPSPQRYPSRTPTTVSGTPFTGHPSGALSSNFPLSYLIGAPLSLSLSSSTPALPEKTCDRTPRQHPQKNTV